MSIGASKVAPGLSPASEASSKCSGRMPTMTSRSPTPPSAWRTLSGNCASPKAVTMVPPLSCPGRKFIEGLPMKPATNRLFGWAYRWAGEPTC
jgi:hypothetical protein